MAFAPVPGQRVMTTRFGEGVVIKPTALGALVMLDRMPRTPLEIPTPQLTLIGGVSQSAPARPDETPVQRAIAPQLSDEQLRSRRSIEALRFGVVPMAGLRDVTIGYDALEKWVIDHLPHLRGDKSHVSEVSGSFGSGKSHTMAAIRLISMRQGYVTAHVEVNGSDVSLSDPEGVLRQLWPTAIAPDLESSTPLLDLNLRAIKNGKTQTLTALCNYARVESNLTTIDALDDLGCLERNAEDIEEFLGCGNAQTGIELQTQLQADVQRHGGNWRGEPIVVKKLIGRRTEERPNDFIDCLLGYAILANRAGYKGLVITIDEFEVEYTLPFAKLERVQDLFVAMIERLSGEASPITVFIATVGQEGHTGDAIVGRIVAASGGDEYTLEGWSPTSLRELAKRLHALYCQAYELGKDFDERKARAIEEAVDVEDVQSGGLVRAFIKRYVALLDADHGPGVRVA